MRAKVKQEVHGYIVEDSLEKIIEQLNDIIELQQELIKTMKGEK